MSPEDYDIIVDIIRRTLGDDGSVGTFVGIKGARAKQLTELREELEAEVRASIASRAPR